VVLLYVLCCISICIVAYNHLKSSDNFLGHILRYSTLTSIIAADDFISSFKYPFRWHQEVWFSLFTPYCILHCLKNCFYWDEIHLTIFFKDVFILERESMHARSRLEEGQTERNFKPTPHWTWSPTQNLISGPMRSWPEPPRVGRPTHWATQAPWQFNFLIQRRRPCMCW